MSRGQTLFVGKPAQPAEDLALGDYTLPEVLGPELLQQLLADGRVQSYSAGERVSRSDTLDEVHVVLEGEVALLSREAHATRLGVVRAGESLELDAVFAGAADWHFLWECRRPTRIARFPFRSLLARAGALPAFDYLERVTRYPELRKLARDLRLFRLGRAHIRCLVSALTLHEVSSRVDLRLDVPHLGVVQRGRLDVEFMDDGSSRIVADYLPGDAVLLGHSDDLSFEPAVDTSVWLVPYGQWRQLEGALSAPIEQFVRLIEPLSKSGVLDSALRSEEAAADQEPRSVAGGEDEGPEIDAFVADEQTLARLQRRKRPFVPQQDEMDCGAACMSMVARFHRRNISLPTFRSLLHVTREGSSLFSLKKAAQAVGFEAIGVFARYEDLQRYLVPFVALTEYHFVVVYRVTPTEVVVGDPAHGVLSLSAEQFRSQWSQIALLLKPTPALARFPESAASFRKYRRVLSGFEAPLVEILLAVCLLFVLGLAPPLFMQFIFDKVLPSEKYSLLNRAVLTVLALTVTTQLVGWARDYLLLQVGNRADAKFSALFLRRTFDLPLGFFAVRHVGAITLRLEELTRIRSFLTDQSLTILINCVTAILYAAVLALYHVQLLLIVLATAPLTLLLVRLFSPRLKRLLQETFKLEAKSRSMAFEHFSRFETIKSVNGMVAARWRWDHNLAALMQLQRRAARIGATISGSSTVVDGTSNVIILLASVWFYTRGELSLGQVIATNAVVASINGPIAALAGQWASFAQLGVSLARVDDVITSAPEASGTAKPNLNGHIAFENLSFQYGSELSPMVLENVSLEIRAGETVAFVGHSGSGKTTLAHMVNLLYVPTKGRVLLDGVDARTFSLAELRTRVAMITQDNSMFSGTILENITIGDPNPSFERALWAAKAADAHDFINGLRDKYSTQLGEGGSGLSGGQKQRLNIARALYREPAILVMDEATASLDSVSERRILRNLKEGAQRRTTIIIAHRLNTVMNAERIFVFDRGRLVESGSHADLLRSQGHYSRLFQKQLSAKA